MTNPYAPPVETAPLETEEQEVKKKLARPATALLIMASTHSVFYSLDIIHRVIFWRRNPSYTTPPQEISILLFFSILFLSQVFIAVGSAKMSKLESYRLARFAMVLACIPFLSPFYMVGVPFGIWGLVLLASSKSFFHDGNPVSA
jgi:hypothetical protein